MDGYLPVKVMVPLDEYRRLNAEAQAAGVTVADLIVRRMSPPQPVAPKRTGRPSGYTTKAGEEITAGRRFVMSWAEIGRQLGISEHTARTWAAKYENEVREQNMRDRAERRAS